MPLKILPERPLDAVTVSVIRAIERAATDLVLPAYLVGATARVILLEHVYGMRAGRATRDLDFAFAVEDWDQFQALKRHLISTSGFEESKTEIQRLGFRPGGARDDVLVDLIPYGGVELHDGTIAWPPDMNVVMNVVGYQDAYDSAALVEIESDLVVRIASIPGIAVLKLFAWADRGRENPKDAMDLLTICQQYTSVGNQDRVYEDALTALEAVGYDVDLAGAWLLGADAARTCSEETRSKLKSLFEQTSTMERLVADMSRDLRFQDHAIENSQAFLHQFQLGFKHVLVPPRPRHPKKQR